MNFLLETTDMDLGDTLIENIFINDFMPMANGTHVKVYLLGFKYACDKDESIELDNQVIARHLEIPLEDVMAAWDFWENKGIVVKIPRGRESYDYGIKFKSLKQLYIKNNLKLLNCQEPVEKKDLTPDDLIDANHNPMINTMFKRINDTIRRETTVTEKMEILSWMQDYNMNPDVIEFAFDYAVETRGVRSGFMKYVAKTIVNWYDRGLTNMEAIMEDFRQYDERYYVYKEIQKNIGFTGLITQDMKNKMNKWLDKYNYSMDLILEACKKSSGTSNPNLNYIDAIINGWYEEGVRELSDLDKLESPQAKKASPRKGTARKNNYKNRFHNFKQESDKYTAEEINEIARKKREKYFEKFKGDK